MTRTLIYGLVDPRTLLVRYVGKSTSGLNRPRSHGQRAHVAKRTHVACWIRGLQRRGLVFQIAVLEYAEAHVLDSAERWWIAYGRASGWPLANHTDGGEGSPGWRASPETRKRMSLAARGKPKSADTRARMSAAAKGKPKSPAMRDKMRAIALARPPMGDLTRAKCARAGRRRWGLGLMARVAQQQEEQRRIAEMRADGKTWREVADVLGLSPRTARRRGQG